MPPDVHPRPHAPPRFDLHVHTSHSRDAQGTVLECAQAAKRAGLAGLAITDHNVTLAARHARNAGEKTGLLVVPGAEVSTIQGHMLAFGVSGKVPAGPSMIEALEWAEERGGIGVPSHPLRLWTGIGPTDLRELVGQARLEAVEVENGRDRHLVRANVARLAAELGLAATGGSDAHQPADVGTCWTEITGGAATVDDVVEAIRTGRIEADGGKIPASQIWRHRAQVLRKRD